jgi:predicted DCC family thiol-disulfide oxidoreductase YuxK
MLQTQHNPILLTAPSERPEADIVIYDGHCRICTAQIQRLARWDAGGRLAFLSLHDPEVHRRWPDLTHEAMMQSMLLIDRAGGRHWGAEAIRYLSIRLWRLWLLAPLLHLPFTMRLWQWCYRQVANRRYKLGGMTCDDGACQVHYRK